jgi:hypothetical protein
MIYSLEDLTAKPGCVVVMYNIVNGVPSVIRVGRRKYVVQSDGLYKQSNR